MLCGFMICAGVCAYSFIGRYFHCGGGERGKKKSCSLVSWPINNPHQLSWQLAPHFCPSPPVRSPERPSLRHLGDMLPISPAEHLWGWALWQSSSNTWMKERRRKSWEEKGESKNSPSSLIIFFFFWSLLDVAHTGGKTSDTPILIPS